MRVINFNELDLSDLNFVMIDGHAHIGIVEETADGVVVSDSLDCGSHVEPEDINAWIKKGNLGELGTQTIKGNKTYTVADIPSDMLVYFEKRLLDMRMAKKTTLLKMVNEEFDRLR